MHSLENQIQAYLKQHACPRASGESLDRTSKGRNYCGADWSSMHKFGSFFGFWYVHLFQKFFLHSKQLGSSHSDLGQKSMGWHSPNGAGKTTMMDIITGKTRPDEGQVFFGSTIDLLRHNEPEIAQLGIGRKFQKPTVFENLSVFENLELALKTPKDVKSSIFFKLDSVQSDRLAEVLHTIHLADSVLTQAGNLSHGQKQWLEIGMLLMQDPKLLLLDEPVAGMTDHETERTAELFLSLKGKHSLMVVEHDMGFIETISDIVTVLCDGSVLAQGTLDQVQADERVIEVYLGR